jgi:hypothetical protein
MAAGTVDQDVNPHRGLKRAAQALNCDRITAEVVTAMNAAGIPNLVLKGPSIARWLYPTGGRTYGDTDLLVRSQDFVRAEGVLASLGFTDELNDVHPLERLLMPREEIAYARRAVTRGVPRGTVDLHHNLPHLPAPEATLWEEFCNGSETILVAGAMVQALGRTALTFHIVVHAAQHEFRFHTDEDLRRVIRVLPLGDWRPVAELADRLGGADILGYGLRHSPEGTQIADLFDLPSFSAADSPYWRASSPRGSDRLAEFWKARSLRVKFQYVVQTLIPSRTWVRFKSGLPDAEGFTLVRAYCRFWWGASTTVVSTIRYFRARQKVASSRGHRD